MLPKAINRAQYDKFLEEYNDSRDKLQLYLQDINPTGGEYILHCIERMIDAKIVMAMYELRVMANQMERI